MRVLLSTLLLCTLSATGCDRVSDCKKGTVYVDLHYPANVDHVSFDVELSTGEHASGVLANPTGQTSGSAELDFNTYPAAGTTVTIHLRASASDVIVAGKSATATIVDGCTKISLTLDDSELDGGSTDIGVDDSGADLRPNPCGNGNHYCDNVAMCVTDDSVDHCAGGCDPCPVVTNGTGSCDPVMGCTATCNTGFTAFGGTCDIVAPRPIFPSSNKYTADRSPTFEWALAPDTSGAHLQLCPDRACATPIFEADVSGTSYTPGDIAYTKVIFWRVAGRVGTVTGTHYSPFWEYQVLNRAATAQKSVFGTLRDINNDGYGDVVVGDPNTAGIGTIYVHNGSSTGIPAAAGTVYPGGATGENFGRTLALLGDVNGDGYADLVAGSFGGAKAWVLLGSATGLDVAHVKTLTEGVAGGNTAFGDRVFSAGDLNGDGYGDLFVGGENGASQGGWVFYGSATGLPLTPSAKLTLPVGASWFGYSAAGAGDINHDGYGDLFIGDNMASVVHVYLGSATGINPAAPSQTIAAPGAVGGFGLAMAGCDMNGDGFSDLIATSQSVKQAWYFKGMSTGLASIFTTTVPSVPPGPNSYGGYVDCLGDTVGDGFPDVIITTGNNATQNVYPGYSGGMNPNPIALTVPANSGFTGVGFGDIDGDGYSDFGISTPQGSNMQQFQVYRGGPTYTGPTVFTDAPTTGLYSFSLQ